MPDPAPLPAAKGPFASIAGLIDIQKKVDEAVAAGADPVAQGLPAAHEIRDKLDREFWKTYSSLAESVVDPQLPDDLTFTPQQRRYFNFGVFAHPDFNWSVSAIDALANWRPSADCRYGFQFMTDAMNLRYRYTKRVDKIKQLNEEKKKVAAAIQEHPAEVKDLLHERDQTVVTSLGAGGEKVLGLYKNWERLLVPYLEMERDQKAGKVFPKEKIIAFTKLRAQLGDAKQSISNALRAFPESKAELEGYLDRITAKHKELFALQNDQERTEDAIFREEHEVGKISASNIKDDLRTAITGAKSLIMLSARKLKIQPKSMPLTQCRIITPDEVLAALKHLEEFDPRVFENRKVKKGGIPKVLLVPGNGNGVYDYDGDRIMIPMYIPKDPLESVAAGICMYRDDIDQSINERQMMGSFKRELKENAKIRSALKLRQKFGKLYLLFMTKETTGIPKLKSDERAWFEWQIAPNKNEPRIPSTLRGLTSKQLKTMAAEIEQKDGQSVQGLHTLALIYCQTEEKPDKALEYITKALAKAPDDLDLLYNTGVLLKAANKKDKSRELLMKYLKNAPQSWWSKKAQDLMR